MNNQIPESKKRIRIRDEQDGSVTRPYSTRFRMTRETSKRLASIQGLCYRYGKRETLAELFERVCLPALAEFVKPYAAKAEEDRKES